MDKDPAVLFYTSDFLTGTAFFTDAERGQYIRLLCEQHQIGHIPENHMVTVCLTLGSPVVKKFVRDEEGYFYNERMEIEIKKRAEYNASRRKNGLNGGRPKEIKGEKQNHMVTHMPPHTEDEDVNENDNRNIIQYGLILENYHSLCPKMSKVEKLTERRRGFVNARYGEYGMDGITKVLRLAGGSEFLNGVNDRAWKADFEWLMRPENFVKVLEGKYTKNGTHQHPTQQTEPTKDFSENGSFLKLAGSGD